MPKLLVLFDPRSNDLAPLADAIAEGARQVRFAEVDVRRMALATPDDTPVGRHRALESADALATYDGIIVGVAPVESPGESPIEALSATTASLTNRVGSAFTAGRHGDDRRSALWSVLTPMGDRGMILVPPPLSESPADELESARDQGKRVAEVVGWVTHARSHHHHH
jgi:hypothetical protein